MRNPLIAVTLDYIDPSQEKDAGYTKWSPWYALRHLYIKAIEDAAAQPILIPYVDDVIPYLDMCDGLLLTGGGFDIDPNLYGEKKEHDLTLRPKRTHLEKQCSEYFINNQKPVLGICGGMQLLTVLDGGTLYQHIDHHDQPMERHLPHHNISVKKDTLLSKLMGQGTHFVNSIHHQSVKSVGFNSVVNAVAEDGIVEGMEYSNHPFCLGVQWHPECYSNENDKTIFREFIKACV